MAFTNEFGNGESKTICKCLSCGKKFEFKDAAQKPTFSITRPACPYCKSDSFTFLKLANRNDEHYLKGSKFY